MSLPNSESSSTLALIQAYCVCSSSLAAAEGWRVHLRSRRLWTGRRTRPRWSAAWARWAWKGGTAAWGGALPRTGCRTAMESVRRGHGSPHRGRARAVRCVASSGEVLGARWCATTAGGWCGWAGGSSIRAGAAAPVGAGERWNGGVTDAVLELGTRTRWETRAEGWGIRLQGWAAGCPPPTGPGGGSRNRGRSSLCYLGRRSAKVKTKPRCQRQIKTDRLSSLSKEISCNLTCSIYITPRIGQNLIIALKKNIQLKQIQY